MSRGEDAPIHRFPILGRRGPVGLGGIENLPPPLHVVGFGIGLFRVLEVEVIRTHFLHRGDEAGAALLGQFLAQLLQQGHIVILRDAHVVAGLEDHSHPLVEHSGNLVPGPGRLGRHPHLDQLDAHGAADFAALAAGADPHKARVDEFLIHAKRGHADALAAIQAFVLGALHPRQGAAAGARAAGVTGIHMRFRKNFAKDALLPPFAQIAQI